MRRRLAEHAPVYAAVRDNFAWQDHAMRALMTGGIIATIAPETILDPACGDASILEAAFRHRPFTKAYLYDVSIPQVKHLRPTFPCETHQGDIMDVLATDGQVDMIVLTEILEHLEDPDRALRLARLKADFVVASSPIGDPEDGRNHEHLWAWDEADYEEMIRDAGWTPIVKVIVTYPGQPWNTQIWVGR